jgi:hypothetical protein
MFGASPRFCGKSGNAVIRHFWGMPNNCEGRHMGKHEGVSDFGLVKSVECRESGIQTGESMEKTWRKCEERTRNIGRHVATPISVEN